MSLSSGDKQILKDVANWFRRNRNNLSNIAKNTPSRMVASRNQNNNVLLFTVKNASAAGSSTAENTFVYDVFLPSDPSTAILTNVSPVASPHLHQRHGIGECKPATSGTGYEDNNGDWIIASCNEVLITGPCDGSTPDSTGGTDGTCALSSGETVNASAAECTALGGTFTPNPGGA